MNWRARWIWSPGEPSPRNFYWCVRKEFQLAGGFREVKVAISADSRYTLWFNGRFIGHGPVRGFYHHWYYDVHDVTQFAHGGLNAIAVLVHHWGMGNFQYDYVRGKGRGGLIAQVEADGRIVAASDASWLNAPHPAFDRRASRMSCQLGFDEHYDARRAIGDWTMPKFDDYDWNEAVEIGEVGCEPWGELHPRPIPYLTFEPLYPQRVLRARVVQPPKGAWAFDLKPYLAEGDLTANPRFICGLIATELRVSQPTEIRLRVDHHWDWNNKVRLNGELLPAGAPVVFTAPAGSHLLTIDVSRSYHDWYYYPVLDWEGDGVQLVNPLIERADYPWVVVGPFEGTDTDEFRQAVSLNTLQDLRRHPKVIAVDTLHTAPANVFSLTVNAKPTTEKPRIENATNAIRSISDSATLYPPESGDLEVWLEFRDEVSGYVEMELEAPEGVIIDFNGFEYLDPVRPDRVQWTHGLNNTFRYITRRGWQRFQSVTRRGFRYATLTCRFPEGTTAPVHLRSVRCYQSLYPYEERGEFVCSDALLNRIYHIARTTVQLCSEDTYIDCPTYEQTFWVGDARNESLFAYACFGDYRLARRCLLLAGQSTEQSPIVESQVPSAWENLLTAWALLWAIACYEYYLFTGDEPFLKEVFSYIVRQNESFHTRYINNEGLLDIEAWNMLDWAPMDTPGRGVVSHQNMWLVKAWEDTAKIADLLGETTHAQTWRQWANDLRKAINQYLWNEAKRAYTDCLREDGTQSPTYSMQTQVVALLCDIPTPERRAILEGSLENPPADFVQIGSPFMSAFLLELLLKLGRRQQIIETIRRDWGLMVQMGASTCWEMFPTKRPPNPLHAHEAGWLFGPDSGWFTRSHCHAWSAAPAYMLPATVLGLEILEPSLKRVRITPFLGNLEWAYGKFPTPTGVIDFALEQVDGKIHLHLTVPDGTIAEVGDREYPAGRHEIVVG